MASTDIAQLEAAAAKFRSDYLKTKAEIQKAIVGHEQIIDGVLQHPWRRQRHGGGEHDTGQPHRISSAIADDVGQQLSCRVVTPARIARKC